MTKTLKRRRKKQGLYARISGILAQARSRVARAINTEMVWAYWLIGREIVVEEQKGKSRADYGKKILEDLAKRLTVAFGKGFDDSNLWHMRKFYQMYPILDAVRRELGWTHYRMLMRVDYTKARSFYEIECAKNQWSTRELERQIGSMLFERLALSKDKKTLMRLSKKGQEIQKYEDVIKDPFVLEFTGLPAASKLYESRLEQALIDHLSRFLLELGKGFTFAARQKRITLDGDHYFIDLVFYHTLLRCFVLIDLKVGKLTHQDLGQMQMYVNYYDRQLRGPEDNPTVGFILCEDKKEAVVRYTLPQGKQRIFASKYKLHLPTEKELQRELARK